MRLRGGCGGAAATGQTAEYRHQEAGMRPCFICKSESDCGHREPAVILAERAALGLPAAERMAVVAQTETRSSTEARKPIERATSLETAKEVNTEQVTRIDDPEPARYGLRRRPDRPVNGYGWKKAQ